MRKDIATKTGDGGSPSAPALRTALAALLAATLAMPAQWSFAAEGAEAADSSLAGALEGREAEEPAAKAAETEGLDTSEPDAQAPEAEQGSDEAPKTESPDGDPAGDGFADPGAITFEEGSGEEPQEERDPVDALALADGTGEVRLAQSSVDAGVDPEHFLPGVSGQDKIKLSVLYRPDPTQSGRWFTVKLPECFSISTAPTTLESGTIEKKDSRTLVVRLDDSMSVDVVFDIVVSQGWMELYEEASAADCLLPFALESYTSAGGSDPVSSSSLDFKIAKFAAPRYSFDIDAAAKELGDVSKGSSRVNIWYDLTVAKAAYTASDPDFKIAIPKTLVSAEGDVLDYGGISGGGYKQVGSDDFYVYVRPSNLLFDYATSDKEESFRVLYNHRRGESIFSNEVYRSPKDVTASSSFPDASMAWGFDGTLSLDTAITEGYERAVILSTTSVQKSTLAGETGVSANIEIEFSPYEPAVAVKDAEAIIDIPAEVVLKSGSGDAGGGTWAYVTNKGRQIKADAIPGLDPGEEWVVQARYRGPLFSRSSTNGTHLVSTRFVVDVRSSYPDGTPVPDTTASYGCAVTPLSDSTAPLSKDVAFSIAAAKDNLSIEGGLSSVQVGIGLTGQTLGLFNFTGNSTTMVYENARIEIGDSGILSLVDGLEISSELYGAVVEYTTNAGTSGSIRVSDIGGPSPGWCDVKGFVPEGEHLTSLSLAFDALDGRNLSGGVILKRFAAAPESLPSDPSGASLEGECFKTEAIWTAQGAAGKNTSCRTCFYRPVDQAIVSVGDLSPLTYCPNDSASDTDNRTWHQMAFVKLAKIADDHRIMYQGMAIDFSGTDPRVLSLVRKVETSGYLGAFGFQFTTNLNDEPQFTGGGSQTIDFSGYLREGEYLTSLKLVPGSDDTVYMPYGDSYVNFYMAAHTWAFVDPEGPFPEDPTSYEVKAAFSASNSSAYEAEGKSVSFHDEATAKVKKAVVSSSVKNPMVYQGEEFSYSISSKLDIVAAGNFRLESPTFYVKVGEEYSYREGSMVVRDLYGNEIEAVVAGEATPDGGSVLKIELPGYSFDTFVDALPSGAATRFRIPKFSFDFDMRTKPTAVPGSGKKPVERIWTDLNASAGSHGEGYVPVALEGTTTDAGGETGLPAGTALYRADLTATQTVLELTEVGASTLARADVFLDSDVEGRDDSDFGQLLSLVSHVDAPTNDWTVYVPVPKKGLAARYQEQEGGSLVVKETAPSEFSMSLTGPVEDAGDGAAVTYSTDAAPSFDLQGGSAGTYVDASAVADWSAVTMVRIEIPQMGAREKRFPVLRYESERKAEVGGMTAYTGVYYNFKLGDSADWYRGEGAYGAKDTYALADFLVTGYAWSQPAASALADPAAPEADRSPLPGVTVSTANAVTGAELSATTGADGRYSLPVPSHGDYALSVGAGSSAYELVEKGDPADPASSKFDPADAQAQVTLSKVDAAHVNAGFSVAVNSDPTVLPATGGPGAAAFAASGAALLAAAAAALRRRRRRAGL